MKPLFDNVCIIGVGLIGGSMGMALCNRGLAKVVTGVDVNLNDLELAVELAAIHKGAADPVSAAADADLVVIATPVGLTLELLKRIAPVLKPGCIVTDVGSTKSMIVSEADKIMPEGTCFVGGHPMTGSEVAGVKGADRYLFENAAYILTPSENTDREAVEKIEQLAQSLGARVTKIDPCEHDVMVAAVSHLPHLVATVLVNTVDEIQKDHEGVLMLAAGGFRDTTRVASGQPLMWRDICLTNKDSILRVLDIFTGVLQKTRNQIESCDDKGLVEGFIRAREVRNTIPSKMRGYLPAAFEIVVTVPDKPGVISKLAGYLGSEGINIHDIEIMRVREGEGGTIRIALGSEADQLKAVEILRFHGITVKTN